MFEKLKQLFCKHKIEKFIKRHKSGFVHIGGDAIAEVCVKCGKEVRTYFMPND